MFFSINISWQRQRQGQGQRQGITEYYRILQSITKYYRVLQSITECDRVLQSITEFYSVAECYRVLQSITKTKVSLVYLLGPIFEFLYLQPSVWANKLIERKLLLSPQRHFLRKGFLLPTTGEVWDNLWKWGGICELWCEKRRNNGTMEHSAHGSLGTHTCVSSKVKRRIC